MIFYSNVSRRDIIRMGGLLMADEEKEYGSRRRNFRQKPGDLVFAACLFIGLGVGIALNQVAAGVLIGLGVGFLGLVIVRWKGVQ
jgi:hypothetical protein